MNAAASRATISFRMRDGVETAGLLVVTCTEEIDTLAGLIGKSSRDAGGRGDQ